jgi:hypothetical protein
MRTRVALLSSMLAALGGCSAISGDDPSDVGNPPPECRAEGYAFAGRGTLAGLGLVGQSAAELPEPGRPAKIWVTREPVQFDAAAPGGSRMLCFEFDDGSGGTEWPVNAAWQPPGARASAEVNLAVPLILVAVMTLLTAGAFAFRRR